MEGVAFFADLQNGFANIIEATG